MNESIDDKTPVRRSEPLCLEFTNTVGDHASQHPSEHMHGYSELIAWGQRAELLTSADAQHLHDQARQSPPQAEEVYRQAVVLRETIYRIFTALTNGSAPAAEDMDSLNAALDTAPMRLRLTASGDGFAYDEVADNAALDGFLGPVMWSAAHLLASEDVKWVKQCADDTCGWLFLDTTKNHSRRWCDMADCGSRAKAQRYYRRKRAG